MKLVKREGKWLLAALAVSGLTMSQAVHAEEVNKEAITLGQVVITATKTEKKVEDAPGSVSVITREEMKKQNVQTVDDALKTLPGVYVKRSKGLMDSTASVNMRGFYGDKYTLVMLDGQPVNDGYTGGVEWGALPVGNIERIEVIRGAASALYGGNAMGGVINIITKTPDKPEAEAGAGFCSHNSYRYHMSAGNRFSDKLSLRVGFEEEGTDGYVTTPVTRTISSGTGNVAGGYPMNDKYGDPAKWVVGDKGENGAEKQNLDGKAVFDFSDTGNISFAAVSGRHEYDYGPPNTYMGTFGDNTTYAIAGTGQRARFRPNDFISYTGIGKNETDAYTLALEEIFGPVKIHAQAGTVQIDDRYTTESGSGMDDYYNSAGSLKITENEAWFSELRSDLPIGESHLLTTGLSYRTDSSHTNDYAVPFYRSFDGAGPSTFYSGGKSKSWAAFIQDEWQVAAPLTFYVGARYDAWKVYDGASGAPGAETVYDSNTESELSPKIAAVWKVLDDTTLRASVGHAFRAPTLYELYRTWSSGSTTYQSNPNLKPETVWSYELGVDQYFFAGKTRLSVTGYRNDTKDLIYNRVSGLNKIRTNAGKARTYGLEFEAAQKVTDWLDLWGNFTYTDARITDNPTDPDSVDKRLTGVPETVWSLGLDASYKCVKGRLAGRYFSKIYNDSDNGDVAEGVYSTYEPTFLVDAKLTATPVQWAELSLSIDNIFDEENYQYYKTDGRTVMAELTFRY